MRRRRHRRLASSPRLGAPDRRALRAVARDRRRSQRWCCRRPPSCTVRWPIDSAPICVSTWPLAGFASVVGRRPRCALSLPGPCYLLAFQVRCGNLENSASKEAHRDDAASPHSAPRHGTARHFMFQCMSSSAVTCVGHACRSRERGHVCRSRECSRTIKSREPDALQQYPTTRCHTLAAAPHHGRVSATGRTRQRQPDPRHTIDAAPRTAETQSQVVRGKVRACRCASPHRAAPHARRCSATRCSGSRRRG